MITLGIDISNAKFDVALLRQGKLKHKTFRNDSQGYQALLAWLTRQEALTAHVCLEATGIYGEPLAECLVDAGLVVSLVNPARVKGFAQSELLRTKSDKADAGLIARFCAAMQPAPWQPQPKEIRQLRALVRRLERGRMSKMGRRALRKAFFMPALVALKHNPLLIDMKARLTVAGKPKMAIVGAAMRKLIHIVYGVLKHKTPFNPLLTAQNA
jgi:transposase